MGSRSKHQEPGCCGRSTAMHQAPACLWAWRKCNCCCPLEGCRACCPVTFSCAVTPFCWTTWCQGLFSVLWHGTWRPLNSRTQQINYLLTLSFCFPIYLVTNNSLSVAFIAHTTQRKVGVALKGEFSVSEDALTPLRMCTAAFPTSCSFALGGKKDRTSETSRTTGLQNRAGNHNFLQN